jgi:phosphoribosylaminoimidazolecarboxamide formyltransferase
VKISGVSVHLVNDALDSGSIIAQIPVPVFDGDDATSLRQRLLEEACKLYPYCINLFTTNQIHRKNGLLQGSKWKVTVKKDANLWSYVDLLI